MKTQILLVLFAACIAALVPVGAANAKAMECSVARPSQTQVYWSWRLIDNRKCWYAGKTMISKSLLHWPARAPVQAKAEVQPKAEKADVTPVAVATEKAVAAEKTVAAEKRSDLLDAQARMRDYANSFEARWRARALSD